jgi:PIN domain nuclease of toxin-antitoxin system
VTDIVVDASAILAAVKDEPGGRQVNRDARRARISAVNYSEIVGWLAERGADVREIENVVGVFDLSIEAFDGARAVAAGLLAAKTKRRNISLADRACLALAMELGMPVLTGDRA